MLQPICCMVRRSLLPTQVLCSWMAIPSESTGPLDKLKRWMDGCCWMSPSCNIEIVIPLACESNHAITSHVALFSPVCSKSLIIEKKVESEEGTSVEDEIERSKVHWSQLTEHDNDNKEVAEVSNVEVFKSLQRHPTWGHFFCTFGDGGIYDAGELVVGEKFAEGRQAELYHTRVTWSDPNSNSFDQESGIMWVLKVFRKGTFLRVLQKQWPLGMFRDYEETMECYELGECVPTKYTCIINCGTLLPDGRFAFLLQRENEDLRTFIDRKMNARSSLDSGPFPMRKACLIMYDVAKGVDWLHNLDIVHRDLKASNVLCTHSIKDSDNEGLGFHVADFECSIGVVGTGFFRAPEILQALKNKVVNERPNVFTKASDVYSYGMVCYEILTGKLPFEGHPIRDYDLVLSGQQLEVPHYVDEWVHDLLRSCWQFDPSTRPTFGEILRLFKASSKDIEGYKRQIEEMKMLPLEEQKRLFRKYEFES